MDPVTVNKTDLLRAMEANRSEHRKIFEEAIDGYKKRAVELLEEHIERIRTGKLEQVRVHLPLPADHTLDYDRVIGMVEMHQGDTVQLGEFDYQCYVLDEWGWKHEFLTSSAAYSVTAAAALS